MAGRPGYVPDVLDRALCSSTVFVCPVDVWMGPDHSPAVWHSVDRVGPNRVFTVTWLRFRAPVPSWSGGGAQFLPDFSVTLGCPLFLSVTRPLQSGVTVVSSIMGTALRRTVQTSLPSTHPSRGVALFIHRSHWMSCYLGVSAMLTLADSRSLVSALPSGFFCR